MGGLAVLARVTGTEKPDSGVPMLDRSSLFNTALTACGNLRVLHPTNVTIKSVISQLRYLMDLDAGRIKDRSRLDSIVIGVLARREIVFLDSKAAELLEEVADEARKMEAATPEASPIVETKELVQPTATSTPMLISADVRDGAAILLPAPVPVSAPPANSAGPLALAPPLATASSICRDIALVGPLSGANDVTVRPGDLVEAVIAGRRTEAPGRVRGGLVADEVLAQINAEADRDATRGDGRVNPLKFAYLQCRMCCRSGLVRLVRMGGYDDFQARSIVASRRFRMTKDDLAFEQRRAQRLVEKTAPKPLKRA